MSYAIETKKRKFDRILGALTDGTSSLPPSPSQSSLNSRINASSTTLSHDAASDSSKRRRITPTSALAISNSSTTSLSGHYLPSSRAAFLERLETFRHVTKWHIPSTDPINAAAWAKRGWICVDTDTVSCGACRERFHVDLSIDSELLKAKKEQVEEVAGGASETNEEEDDDDDDDFAFSAEIYDNIVKRYQDMIVTAHTDDCHWRKRGSDASIQRIEGLLNTNSTLSGLRTRYDGMTSEPTEMPQVEPLPSTPLIDPEDLDEFRANTETPLEPNALKLAICGWERKSDDVIECRHCFRSLGLWLYRGDSPTIEKLDPVDNHLEYCPWRSAEAQDTEIQTGSQSSASAGTDTRHTVSSKQRVPGWILVYLAISKNNRQRRPKPATASLAPSEDPSSTGTNESLTSEQREKKMKDLLRRIKEIKKPFNVKSLLRKKSKSKSS